MMNCSLIKICQSAKIRYFFVMSFSKIKVISREAKIVDKKLIAMYQFSFLLALIKKALLNISYLHYPRGYCVRTILPATCSVLVVN